MRSGYSNQELLEPGSIVIRINPCADEKLNKPMVVLEVHSFPPCLKLQSLDGKQIYDRMSPWSYRGATQKEIIMK